MAAVGLTKVPSTNSFNTGAVHHSSSSALQYFHSHTSTGVYVCSAMSKCKCFSYTASLGRCLEMIFSGSGLRPFTLDLGDGTILHCWVPKERNPARPDLVLIHGFGATAVWQTFMTVPALVRRFNLYVPDLLFFGKSFTTRPERTEAFQAQCLKRVLEANSVEKFVAIGLSYGGFVAYSMAAQFPESVERVVLCCAGVCMEEKDLTEGIFPVGTVDEAAMLLTPRTLEALRKIMGYVFVSKAVKLFPSCLLQDLIDHMFVEYVEEKKELLHALIKDRKLLDLPKISQPALIMWGDKDQVFPMELAHRLKTHLGENAEMIVFKNAGHCFGNENPRKFNRLLKKYLVKTQSKLGSKDIDQQLSKK